jgi:hypothetical protein
MNHEGNSHLGIQSKVFGIDCPGGKDQAAILMRDVHRLGARVLKEIQDPKNELCLPRSVHGKRSLSTTKAESFLATTWIGG